MKRCCICKRALDLAMFCKNKTRPDGLNSKCRECGRLLWAKYRAENPEAVAEQQRRRREQSPEKFKLRKNKHLSKPESRFVSAKYTSMKRGLAWDIPFEFFLTHVTTCVCLYCSGPLPRLGHGFDRVNNNIGYTPDNVVPCCRRCNFIRSKQLEHAEMLKLSPLLKELRYARLASGGVW